MAEPSNASKTARTGQAAKAARTSSAPNASRRDKKPLKRANLLAIHREDAVSSLKRMSQAWTTSAMTVVVIAVALLLPAFLLVLSLNLGAVVSGFRDAARVTLYLESDLSPEQAAEVSSNLLSRPDVISSEYISSESALDQFSLATGLDSLLANLADNPLPASIVLIPAERDPDAIAALADAMAALEEVESVQVDEQWIRRVDALAGTLGVLARGLGLVILAGVCFIIGNTIKSAIEERRDEIRVIKLVGGTDAFIARPLLYTGLLFGAAGGLLASVLLLVLLMAARSQLRSLQGLFDAALALQGPGLPGLLLLVGAGAALGWLAARLASWRYIRAIDA